MSNFQYQSRDAQVIEGQSKDSRAHGKNHHIGLLSNCDGSLLSMLDRSPIGFEHIVQWCRPTCLCSVRFLTTCRPTPKSWAGTYLVY